jgi:hypothetical protein
MRKAILYIGGSANLLLAVFHVFFWRIFNWQDELAGLSRETAGILQIGNICVIYFLLFFSASSFILSRHEKTDVFARSIILCIAGFYAIRIVAGLLFFGLSSEEMAIWALCLLLVAGYGSLLFVRAKK